MTTPRDFADYCCELLASIGPCSAKRMFGGWGISTQGLTVALLANLGDGDTLWLKADADTRSHMEAAGCKRFSYASTQKGIAVERSVNYYSAPDDAMESPDAMAPWARSALECALKAQSAKRVSSKKRGSAPKTAKK